MKENANRPQSVVYVVDDDEGVRKSLNLLLTSEAYTVKTYSTAEKFLTDFDPRIPGCLILDLRMPGMSGHELQEVLLAEKILLPTIVMSAHGNIGCAVKAMKLGSFDFLEKPYDTSELLALVKKAHAHAINLWEDHQWRYELRESLNRLTPREQEILVMVVAGKPSKHIADVLKLSVSTVDNHRDKIMKKLKAETTADLARITLSAKPELARVIAQ